jgi:hypothetical protein
MTPATSPFRKRVEQLVAQAAENGISFADMITTQEDAARLERMIGAVRQRKLEESFGALVRSGDAKRAMKMLDEVSRSGDARKVVANLEQAELIEWLRKLPEAARERVLELVAEPAFVRAWIVPDAEVPRFVEVRGAGRMNVSTDPIAIDARTANRLRGLGVPVRAPRRDTVPVPEPHVYPGLVLHNDRGVYAEPAWKAILGVDERARAYVEAGELIVTPMPLEYGRLQLQRKFTEEGRR